MNNINVMYTDLSPDMGMAWNRDVARSVGTRAVKNSLLGIITTKKGSKPFDPNFGCDVSNQLFENMSPLTANTLERSIVSAVRTYEPRIVELSVSVVPQYDANAIVIDIRFSILDNPDVLEQLKLQLDKN